jgi:hypothetical protein
MMLMREYSHGVLRKEAVLRVGQVDLRRKEVKTDKALRSEERRAAAKVRLSLLTFLTTPNALSREGCSCCLSLQHVMATVPSRSDLCLTPEECMTD